MSLKSKIITKIKAKVKAEGTNLSNVRINGLADKLDAIIENEDDIDGEIDKLDNIMPFKELAALDDAKRNADKLKAEQEDEGEEEEEEPVKTVKKKAESSDDDKVPSWFESYTEKQDKTIAALTSQLTAFQSGQTNQSRRQQLEEKIKDAPDKFKTRVLRDFDRLKLDSDDDFTNYLADVEQDVADEVQAESDAGLGVDAPFKGAGGGKIKEATQQEVEALFGEIKI